MNLFNDNYDIKRHVASGGKTPPPPTNTGAKLNINFNETITLFMVTLKLILKRAWPLCCWVFDETFIYSSR